MGYNRTDDFFYMQAAEQRAQRAIWHKLRVNRYELHILCSLAAYLQVHGKQIVSWDLLTDWLGLGYAATQKCRKYVFGLLLKGIVHRLSYRRPDGYCLSISPYGVKVLEAFYEEVAKIEDKDKARLSHSGFRTLAVDLDNLPQGYVLRQQGRLD